MTDPREWSIEEMVAYCRAEKSGGATPPAEPEGAAEPAAEEAPAPEPAAAAPAAAPPSGKDPREMSVAEMVAMAKGEKAPQAATPEEESPAEEEAPAAAAPPSGKDPRQMSVEEMVAMAKGEKAPKAAAAKPAAKKKPAAAKPAAKPKAKAKPEKTGPKDTASVLTDTPRPKRGPVSKAEAAAAAKGDPTAKGKKKKLDVPPMPEKPAYAVPASPAPASEDDRRGFFGALAGVFVGSSMAAGFTSLALTHLLWLLGLARFMFPNILTEPPTQFKVGFPDDYAPGQVQTKFKAQFGVWIVRHLYEGQPQIFAIKSVCTHLGCTPNWLEGEQKFKCPCHGSGFYKDGVNFEGPAPRPLERYAIKIADDGQLEVDKSQKFQEELGQWENAASYVQV